MHPLYRRRSAGVGAKALGDFPLPGHFKTGRLSRCYTAAPPTLGLTEAPSSISPLRLAPQEGSLLIGGRDMQRKSGQQRGGTIASTCRPAWRI
jgi:hypothetical protein